MSDAKTLRILLAGNINTGKTTLCTVFNSGKCVKGEELKSAKGEKYAEAAAKAKYKTVCVSDDKVVIDLVDTHGEEKFRTLSTSYYDGVDGVLVTFDLTDRASFEDAKQWLDEVGFLMENGQVRRMLVGTKADMEHVVLASEALDVARKLNIPYFEVTATKRKTVMDALSIFTEYILHNKVCDTPNPSSKCVCQ